MEKLFRKGIYFSKLSFFPYLVFKKIQYLQIPKDKTKYILQNILSSNLTIKSLINFVYIKCISSVFKIYVYVMCIRSKWKKQMKKKYKLLKKHTGTCVIQFQAIHT